jgi:AraC-like DNA-binding protein
MQPSVTDASVSARAGISPWPAALVVWGPGSLWTLHAHHSVQVIVAVTGTLRVRTHRRAEWWSTDAVLIPADVSHEVDARGALVLIAFLDPEGELAIPVLGDMTADVTSVSDDVVARWRAALGNSEALNAQRVDMWMARELSSGRRSRRMHAGVRRVLEHLREDHQDRRRTSLTALARVAGLSPSRLMHVFTESVGIPLRPYVRWLRVQRAACALISAGDTVTEAAHLAGFSDAPHLVRTLRRTMGMTPRELLRRVPGANDLRVSRLVLKPGAAERVANVER